MSLVGTDFNWIKAWIKETLKALVDTHFSLSFFLFLPLSLLFSAPFHFLYFYIFSFLPPCHHFLLFSHLFCFFTTSDSHSLYSLCPPTIVLSLFLFWPSPTLCHFLSCHFLFLSSLFRHFFFSHYIFHYHLRSHFHIFPFHFSIVFHLSFYLCIFSNLSYFFLFFRQLSSSSLPSLSPLSLYVHPPHLIYLLFLQPPNCKTNGQTPHWWFIACFLPFHPQLPEVRRVWGQQLHSLYKAINEARVSRVWIQHMT